MSRLTSPLPNPSNHISRLCCCKMSQPMFQTFCLLKFYIRYFWCAVTLDTKWQTNRVKSSHLTLSPFILKTSVSIGFHVRQEQVCAWMEAWMDGGALRREWHALWECSWARIPFLPPLGQPAQMWPRVHAPILWCASSNCSQHTGYMCNQARLYTHTVSVFWGVLLIWKHNSLQIRRESASLSSTIKFLWWLWCSSQWECTNTGYL